MIRISVVTCVLLGAAWSTACGSTPTAPSSPPVARVTGTVTYLPRIALPPTAVVEVTLADVSRADAPMIVVSTQRLETLGLQVPFAYSLTYDTATIDDRLTYAVSARITDVGRLLFVSTRRYAVITRGSPTSNVEVVVDQVS